VSAAHDPETGLRGHAPEKNRRGDASKGMIVKPEDRGGVTDLRTTKAMSWVQAKGAFAAAALAPGFKSAGGT